VGRCLQCLCASAFLIHDDVKPHVEAVIVAHAFGNLRSRRDRLASPLQQAAKPNLDYANPSRTPIFAMREDIETARTPSLKQIHASHHITVIHARSRS
jgi:hypothetical protein